MPVFFAGALGTVLGTIVASLTVGRHLGPDGWKVAAALCATYIGGSANLASTAAALDFTAGTIIRSPIGHALSGPLLAAAVASDNVAMLVYLSVISVIPVEDTNHLKAQSLETIEEYRSSASVSAGAKTEIGRHEGRIPSALTIGFLCCALGDWLAKLYKVQHLAVALMTLISSAMGVVLRRLEKSGMPMLLRGHFLKDARMTEIDV